MSYNVEQKLYIYDKVDKLIDNCYKHRFRTGKWIDVQEIVDFTNNQEEKPIEKSCLLPILLYFINRIDHENPDISYKSDKYGASLIKILPGRSLQEDLSLGVSEYEHNNRRIGKTTRRCNEYIQTIFSHPNIQIEIRDIACSGDGTMFGNTRTDAILVDKIMTRIENEWLGDNLNKKDIKKVGNTIMYVCDTKVKENYEDMMI